MAIIVEHEKRKKEILEKSMELFCKEGFDDVTFQKIADACGITRTTLYIYFKNKHEIFNFSIKQASSIMEVKFLKIIKDPSLTSEQCLRRLASKAVDICLANKSLFIILVPYLLGLKKSGENVDERIRRRTIKINHLFSLIIIRGQKSGEFKDAGIKESHELIYSIIEDFVFRLSIMDSPDPEMTKSVLNLAIDSLVIKK